MSDAGVVLLLVVLGVLAGVTATLAVVAVAARRRLHDIERETLRDELTGTGNHRQFVGRLEAQLGLSRRHAETFSLVLVDLDDFKRINDDVGRAVGDRVLRDVAAELRAALRTEDVLCRQGGDEFSVIAPHTAGREAERLASRLRDAVKDHVAAADGDHPVTVSTGVSTVRSETETPYELVDRADALLRTAKRGRELVGPVGDRTVPAPAPARSPAQAWR
jgi:diguanylate cyclase (GGDEF)-like protein